MNEATKAAVDRIDELARIICQQVPVLIDEARDQINEAINATMEEAQEKEDGKAILSLAITAKWDLDGTAVVVSMPVSVKRKFEVAANMDDPNQPKLPGIVDGDGDEMTEAQVGAVRKLAGEIRAGNVTIRAGVTEGGAS